MWVNIMSLSKFKTSGVDFVITNVKKASKIEKGEKIYDMSAKPRGVCLIINNINYKGPKKRDGAEFDSLKLETLFKELYFAVIVATDLTAWQIKLALETLADDIILKYCQCLVLITMGHGSIERGTGKGIFYGIEENVIDVSVFRECFLSRNSPNSRGIPKIIINNFCRGKRQNHAMSPREDGNICELQDLYYFYSTPEGFASKRNTNNGSWFVQAFVKAVEDHAFDKKISDLPVEIQAELSKFEKDGIKQSCELKAEGPSKYLYFNPGLWDKTIDEFSSHLNKLVDKLNRL